MIKRRQQEFDADDGGGVGSNTENDGACRLINNLANEGEEDEEVEDAISESASSTIIIVQDAATTAAATTATASVTNDGQPSSSKQHLLRIRVCAVCTNEPALSKYSNASAEDMDIIELIQELEDALESGLHIEDGRKMTLRELKGVERKVEKYQLELKQRRTKAKQEGGEDKEEDEEEGEGGYDTDDAGSVNSSSRGEAIDGDDSVEDKDAVDDEQPQKLDYEIDDPFLLATGGNALVGEAYQKMLLAKERKTN
jgi:hypothetical protein